jgi:hypothetical protein
LRDITTYAARWNEQAWRISVCFHAGLYGPQAHARFLAASTAEAAIELADWFAAQQLAILNAGRTDRRLKRAQEVRERLLRYGGQRSLRDLQRHNGIDHAEARALAVEFPGLLRCKETQPTQRGGRISEVLVAVGGKNW